MKSTYNLRQRKRETNCKCYLEQYLEQMQNNTNTYSPHVSLKRVSKLDDPSNYNCTFYVKGNQILLKKNYEAKSNNFIKMVIFFCGVFVLPTLIYINCDVARHFIKFMNQTNHIYQAVDNYYLNPLLDTFLPKIFYQKTKEENLNEDDQLMTKLTTPQKIVNNLKQIVEEQLTEMEKKLVVIGQEFNTCSNEECEENNVPHTINYSFDVEDNCFDFSPVADYSLESKGARILSTFDTEPYGIITFKFLNMDYEIKNFFFQNLFYTNGPTSVLMPWTKRGDCWAFKGSKGQILIELSEWITISSFTIDHIRSYNNITLQSAPKRFSVFGVTKSENQKHEETYLGTFMYKTSGPSLQTFLVLPTVKTNFKMVQFKFESNHGNEDYTCIYKIRVHGYPMSSK